MTTDWTFVFNGDSYNMDNTEFWTKITGEMEAKFFFIILGMRGIRLADHLFGWSQKKRDRSESLSVTNVCLSTDCSNIFIILFKSYNWHKQQIVTVII